MGDGRAFAPAISASVHVLSDGRLRITSEGVGLVRGALPVGSVVAPGTILGELEILGRLHRIVAPEGAGGIVVESVGSRREARMAVDHGATLYILDPTGAASFSPTSAGPGGVGRDYGGPVFRAPTSGRFYVRSSPGAEAFVAVGDMVAEGKTVGLLEVMKTFHRVTYAASPAEGLPAKARVLRIVPKDGDDLERGQVILELAPDGADDA